MDSYLQYWNTETEEWESEYSPQSGLYSHARNIMTGHLWIKTHSDKFGNLRGEWNVATQGPRKRIRQGWLFQDEVI